MMGSKKRARFRERLLRAQTEASLVRVARKKIELGWMNGYVHAIGEDWLALALVDDTIRHAGLVCLRFDDLTKVKVPAPHAAFIETALSLRESPPPLPEVDLTSTATILSTEGLDLVTLHIEEIDSGVCYIGTVLRIEDDRVFMQEIDPDAHWRDEVRAYRLADLTRIDAGGHYEAALAMVANHREAS